MSILDIANLTKERIDRRPLEKAARLVLDSKSNRPKISLVFLTPRLIKDLNRKYRGKNQVTDVLSFGYGGGNGYFGEICVCPSYVRERAKERHLSFRAELTSVFVHGILHLTGYDHRNKKELSAMEKKAENILKKLIT